MIRRNYYYKYKLKILDWGGRDRFWKVKIFFHILLLHFTGCMIVGKAKLKVII